MKICPNCRKEYDDNYNFCLADGTPLSENTTEIDEEIEQETLVNFDPPPVGDETMVMDEKPSSGEETAVLNQAVLTNEELSSDQKETDQKFQSAIPTEEWNNQEVSVDEPKSVVAIPPAEDFINESGEEESFDGGRVIINHSEPEPENPPTPPRETEPDQSRSFFGLILAALGLFLLLFIGITAGGIYLYMQNQDSPDEIAAANNNQETNVPAENTNSAEENSNGENTENENSEDLNGNTNLESNSVAENDNKNAQPTPTKAEKTPTPKPTATKTPTPKPTETRTPTPRPTRTPDNSPPPPPPPTPKPTPKIPKRISRGVVNGIATSLPTPAYPAAARAVRASGSVNVQVLISKSGSVIAARAVSGHPLLRRSAEQAARRARFRPTLLSGQAVEVSGVIVYNFRP